MTMFCITHLSIGLPRHLLWELITDPSARHLWQPKVLGATIDSGYGGGKGSTLTLEVFDGKATVEVKERVIRSRLQDSIVVIQQWPKHQIQNKYTFTAEFDGTTLLTLQKRYKGQVGFALLGKQLTRRQLEASAEEELLGIKNLSTQLHNRMADHTMPNESAL